MEKKEILQILKLPKQVTPEQVQEIAKLALEHLETKEKKREYSKDYNQKEKRKEYMRNYMKKYYHNVLKKGDSK